MKKRIILSGLFVSILAQSALANCEYEQQQYDRYFGKCEDWGKVSGITATVGLAVGLTISKGHWIGAVGGLAGLLPGSVAWRICDLKNQKKEALEACRNYDVWLANEEKRLKKEVAMDKKYEATANFIGNIFARKRQELLARAEAEKTAILEAYIEEDRDTTDPEIVAELEREFESIDKKYF